MQLFTCAECGKTIKNGLELDLEIEKHTEELRSYRFNQGRKDLFMAIKFMANREFEGAWILKSKFMEELEALIDSTTTEIGDKK